MEIKRVCALYFGATGNTEKAVLTVAETLAQLWGIPLVRMPFTKPGEREQEYSFTDTDFTVVGAPTYAGKLPNKILPDLKTRLHGGNALAAAIVTFGNRAYDDSLAELCGLLEENGFRTVAGGAFVGRHAFTDALAWGRPDWQDHKELQIFAKSITDKINHLTDVPLPVTVPGDPNAPYYVPKGSDGQPAKFLKAKPKTDPGRCTGCGACARLCPMGAIDSRDVFSVPGTCIKCQACVRKCTKHAKYFDDPAFLSHVAMLEQNFAEPKKNETFL